jgi:hypothetical protein
VIGVVALAMPLDPEQGFIFSLRAAAPFPIEI